MARCLVISIFVGIVSVLGFVKLAEVFNADEVVVSHASPLIFSSELQAPLGRAVYSDAVVVRGIQAPTLISISKGEFSVDGGQYDSQPQLVGPGQILRVRVESAQDFNVNTVAVIHLGDLTAEFKVRTQTEEFVIETERRLFDQLPDDKWAALVRKAAPLV